MPRLLLLRHAKSSWEDPDVDDYDRPLNTRGRRSAPLMGRHCAQHNLVPQLILCSAARRTRETLAGLLPYFNDDLDVRLCRDLYMTSPETAFERLKAAGDVARSVMLIGHNPSLQQLAATHRSDGLAVLAVNYKESVPVIRRFLQTLPFELPVLLDSDGEATAAWTPRVFPTTVLIGPGGVPRSLVVGEMDWMGAAARELIEPLLARARRT